MKLFKLKISLASCYIFSMLASDILIHEELGSYSELSVSFGKESMFCSIKQRYCLLYNMTPKSISYIIFSFQISFTVDMSFLGSSDKRKCPVKCLELQALQRYGILIYAQLWILVNL